MSGIFGRSSGVSETPNPEIPDLYPEFPGKPKQKANDCARHGGRRREQRTAGKKGRGKGGKMEELTPNPFVRSIWAEEDRGSGSMKKGGARTVLPWRWTVEGRFRPGKARARLMEVWRRCEEWLGGLSWKGSMNGSRRWPGRRRERARLSLSRGGGGGNERERVRERVYNVWRQ